MEIAEILNLTISAITMIGMVFAVFFYFKNPQENLEKSQILNEERDKNKATLLEQKGVENKALVLEKQFQWYMDVNNQKFCDLGKRLDDAFLLAANHTKTVDTKVNKVSEELIIVGNNLTKLSTIIDERIPNKR